MLGLTVTGGTAPYTYAWSGTDIPAFGGSGPGLNQYTISYPSAGSKTAFATVTDSTGSIGSCSGSNTKNITIYIKIPKYIER